ncbi:cysteine synthase CysK [Kipferlia bialata]|uniref:Cysteine synthase n=1 Tax=Kipferlia bialata TaxID=797122 RepID=A0A9K3CP48_9EUKA|nr:cysteine synthase CysK [Kipferlia bialata]|eukprot:g1756.t1
MEVAPNVTGVIGNTPMVHLSRVSGGLPVYGKMECMNPCSSVKDRIALSMIDDMEHRGLAIPGETVFIEATSGNTGIALAMVCAARDYKFVAVMPASMSVERRALMMILGAEVVLSPADLGMSGCLSLVNAICDANPRCLMINQFINKANPVAHRQHTGPEITSTLARSGLKLGAFVAGVGTGGTITGVGQHLRDLGMDREVRVVAVEPLSTPVLSTGNKGPGGPSIQGIGAGFVPGVLDVSVYDEVMTVTYEDALETASRLAKEEGVFCGMSAGANVWAAIQVAKRPDFRAHGKAVVTVVCDTGERYLSTPLFKDIMDKAAELKIRNVATVEPSDDH